MQITETVGYADWYAATQRRSPHPHSTHRWIARGASGPVAGAEISRRPDGKHFLELFGDDQGARRRLIETAVDRLPHSLFVISPHEDPKRDPFVAAGFESVLTEAVFEVAFSEAEAAVARAWRPTDHSIVSADAVDRSALLDLDNRLRQLVPGLDGWTGTREAFDAEFADTPPYDPAAYLVARDERANALVGLIRFWRNPSGPRLGMIAVLPSHRGTTIGPALLQEALPVAGAWGSPHFVTETAITNRHVHRRLVAIGARRIAGFDVLRGPRTAHARSRT